MDTNGDLTLSLDISGRGILYSTNEFKARSCDFSLDDEA